MNAISDGFGSAACDGAACAFDGAACEGAACEGAAFDWANPSINVADLVCIAACNNIHAKNKMSNTHVA
jgi:hypothetical protein